MTTTASGHSAGPGPLPSRCGSRAPSPRSWRRALPRRRRSPAGRAGSGRRAARPTHRTRRGRRGGSKPRATRTHVRITLGTDDQRSKPGPGVSETPRSTSPSWAVFDRLERLWVPGEVAPRRFGDRRRACSDPRPVSPLPLTVEVMAQIVAVPLRLTWPVTVAQAVGGRRPRGRPVTELSPVGYPRYRVRLPEAQPLLQRVGELPRARRAVEHPVLQAGYRWFARRRRCRCPS